MISRRMHGWFIAQLIKAVTGFVFLIIFAGKDVI
jgi:hypothetical protein